MQLVPKTQEFPHIFKELGLHVIISKFHCKLTLKIISYFSKKLRPFLGLNFCQSNYLWVHCQESINVQ